MQQHGGLAGRVAAFLVIELVGAPDLQPTVAVGHNVRIEREAGGDEVEIHGEADWVEGRRSGLWAGRRRAPLGAIVKGLAGGIAQLLEIILFRR